MEGFQVLDPNYLLVLKIYTLKKRGRTPKGKKDLIDIVSLMHTRDTVDWDRCQQIIKRYDLGDSLETLREYLNERYELPELSLNKHDFARFKDCWQKNLNLGGS